MSELLKINVNDHTERKNGLTYLSWAWAWAEVLKLDPQATWVAHTYGPQGAEEPCMRVGKTAMVHVSVTIKGLRRECMLPVMDHRNKAIPDPDAFAVNTAIMRCLAKAIAMHGLGLYIYAGEDLPEEGDVARKGPASVVTPRGGVGEELPMEVKEYLSELANAITDAVKDGAPQEALSMMDKENLEADQKVWLWGQLDSKVRSALKKAKEA